MTIKPLVGWRTFNLCLRVYFILLLHCCEHVKGLVEISPSEVAPVCQAGEQLELTCAISGAFLRWQFTVTLEDGTLTTFMPDITAGSTSGEFPPRMANSTIFTFSRISTQPLTSRMLINPVSEGLNGVQVDCIDREASESATTTIQIVPAGDSPRLNLSIQSHQENFTSDNVTVLLNWGVSLSENYRHLLQNSTIHVVPDTEETTMYTGSMTAQLTLQYNTLYNVSVTQPGVCGQPNQTEFIKLNYSKCSNPEALLTDNRSRVIGYECPALEGYNITFRCAYGLTLNGWNTSTCMDGEWMPDPGDMNCTGTEITTSSAATTSTCMPADETSTCSESSPSNGDANEALKLTLGIVFGVFAAVLVAVVVVLLALLLKRKGFPKHWMRRLDSGDTLDTSDNHKAEESILYADLGPASFPKQQTTLMSNLLHLDDSRVEYALLDHSVHEDKGSTLKVSTTVRTNIDSDNCPPVNLDNLLIQLRPQVSPKWYPFGEAAGIEKEVLDKFAEQCSPDECIVELFDYWLRVSTDGPTWKTVADVLKAINLTELGLSIERVYTTGTLPIEIDMNRVPNLDLQEEEEPPPLPDRITNLYIDTPSNPGSQGSTPRVAVPYIPPGHTLSNEVPPPALPPKPAHMKSANTLDRD